MRILGCLDGTNVEPVSRAARMFAGAEPLTIGLLTVMDVGPRKDIDRTRERFWRPALHRQSVIQDMLAAESEASQDILKAGLERWPDAEPLLRQGYPELEIVNTAADWNADVILVCPRSEYGAPPSLGPHSVGHVARFVLDHAPCPVMLVRALATGRQAEAGGTGPRPRGGNPPG
jgi:nucleotide-binding universal stress UspA family protein